MRIFLAHAREDKAQVRQLYADLKARGLHPWLDEMDLLPGQIWKSEIRKAIREAGVFLACLSTRSVGKTGYVQSEFRTALSAFGERPPGTIYLIPARFDDCQIPDLEIPDRGLRLEDVQWVDLWQDGGFERLVHGIEHALGISQMPVSPDEAATTVLAPPAQQRKSDGTLQALQTFRDVEAPWCPEMVVMPPGRYLMGSPADEEDRDRHEGPQHEVQIADRLAVARYPVTFEEYDRFAGGRELPNDEGWGRARRPVINVSWNHAQAYVAWLSKETGKPYRLLSEAEWEYAARAGTSTRYPWGDQIKPEQANYDSKVDQTTEVGAYPPNPWGLCDMHGNVREWVEDCWNDSYAGAPGDGSAWTSGDCSRRVQRGGSWFDLPRLLRSAGRVWANADNRYYYIGFRVARMLSQSES